ncbi:MAG: tetratricopeptide repeat protein, partial [Planctomycetota bacterium]
MASTRTASDVLREIEQAIAAGDLRAALRASRKFLSRHRAHPRAMRVRERAVKICIKAGDYAEGVRIGEAAGGAADRDAGLLYAIAQAYVYDGRGSGAMRAVERVLRAEPDHAGAIARMAVLLQSERRTDDAIALLDEAGGRGVSAWDLDHAFAQLAPRVGR